MATRRLLIANDDHHLWSTLARELVSKLPGLAVECVGSFDAALASVERSPPGIVLVDVTKGGRRGIDFVERLRASSRGAGLLIIGMSRDASAGFRHQLREVGADECLGGPCNAASVLKCMERLGPRGSPPPDDEVLREDEGSDADVLVPGDSVDGWYLIQRVIGRGAGSVVYEAVDGALDETVAIKVLRSTAPDARERFAVEGQVLRDLRSPHVPAVHLIGELSDGSPYIVMEQSSQTLADRLLRVSLELDEIFEIGRQLLAACAVIHELRIVHRDIKPANIGWTRSARGEQFIKLFDFGVCAVLGATDEPTSPPDTLIGTPEYMAPEQILSLGVDARTDLYAVGVVLYECITGRIPFQGDSCQDVVAAVLRDPILSPAAIRPECSPGLEQVVLRALSHDMDERFQTAAAMASALASAERTCSWIHIVSDHSLRPVAMRATPDAPTVTVYPLVRKKVVGSGA